jgi:cytochrome c biogenesis protein CcmG, thiol:disulfide interchange protein DsbE
MSDHTTSESAISGASPQRRPRWRGALMALPLIGFTALAALFWFGLHDGDPSRIPSALIGRPAPQTTLPALEGLTGNNGPVPGLDPAALKGKVSINYKDSADNARRFLGRYGNPFGIVGVDGNGRAAIEWGVYGVPETFIVGRDGTILFKLVGPVTPDNIDTVLKAEIDKALKAGS